MAALFPRLHDIAALAMVLAVAAVLTAALVLQFGFGEVPCPLCLLERVAMFGVCFGLVLRLRRRDGGRGIGLAMVSALVLLVVSVRQVLLDIVPRPGHDYVGGAVLGLHMPVWSVLIAVALLAGFAAELALLGRPRDDASSPGIARLAALSGGYVTLLCTINLVSVVLQCGAGACSTAGYRWL